MIARSFNITSNWCFSAVMLALVIGCDARDNAPSASPPPATGVETARSPAEVADTLRRLHRQRDYEKLAAFIVPPQREATVTLLEALDAMLAADERLREKATARFGRSGVAWDLSLIANSLGLFSRDIDIITQTFEGDRATLTLQEGGHVPLVRAPFVRTNGRWLYAPDLPPAAMTVELRQLASTLDDIGAGVEKGDDFAQYLESFYTRVLPQMARVATVKDAVDLASVEPDVAAD